MDINTLTAVATYHREQLAAAEKMLDTLAKAAPAEPAEVLLGPAVLEQRVLALAAAENKKTKAAWRKVVLKEDLIDNVFRILEDCYDPFFDMEMPAAAIKARIGRRGSLKWQLFCLEVIEQLYKKGAFLSSMEDGSFDSFEDTAGGCDEVTWDVAMDLIDRTPA
jgi:hypothetical protein